MIVQESRGSSSVERIPRLPQPREGKRFLRFESDIDRGFGLALRFAPPFIKSIGKNETSASLVGRPKGGFLRQGFGARINHAIADFGVLCPRRNQSPLEKFHAVLAVVRHNSNSPERERYVVTGSHLIGSRDCEAGKSFCQSFRVRFQCKSSTHASSC